MLIGAARVAAFARRRLGAGFFDWIADHYPAQMRRQKRHYSGLHRKRRLNLIISASAPATSKRAIRCIFYKCKAPQIALIAISGMVKLIQCEKYSELGKCHFIFHWV